MLEKKEVEKIKQKVIDNQDQYGIDQVAIGVKSSELMALCETALAYFRREDNKQKLLFDK